MLQHFLGEHRTASLQAVTLPLWTSARNIPSALAAWRAVSGKPPLPIKFTWNLSGSASLVNEQDPYSLGAASSAG